MRTHLSGREITLINIVPNESIEFDVQVEDAPHMGRKEEELELRQHEKMNGIGSFSKRRFWSFE